MTSGLAERRKARSLTLFLIVVVLLPLAVFNVVCNRPDAIHQRAGGC